MVPNSLYATRVLLVVSLTATLLGYGTARIEAQQPADTTQQLRRLIPTATAMDRELFETMARSGASPNADDYNDHSLTAELFFTDYQTAQMSEGQFRYLTDGVPKPAAVAKEVYRSIGSGRLQLVTHPVTMIQAQRITKFNAEVEGNRATGSFEFRVPELYEGKAEFSARKTDSEWQITRFQMPKVNVDITSDESGHWWPTADLKAVSRPTCLIGHTDTVWSLDFSKDGTRLVSGSSDHSVRVWDTDSRMQVLTVRDAHVVKPSVPLEGLVSSVCFSPDEQQIASGSDDGTVKLWNAETGQTELIIEVKGLVGEAIYTPDGKKLLISSSALETWDATDGTLINIFKGHSYPTVAINSQGTWIATGGAEPEKDSPDNTRKTVKLWNAKTSEELATSDPLHEILITGLEFSPDGNRIASCARDKTIRIWQASDLQLLMTIEGHEQALQSVSWSPDGRWIAGGDLGGNVIVWNAESGKLEQKLPEHPQGVRCVRFSPNGKQLATSGHDGVIRLWSIETR